MTMIARWRTALKHGTDKDLAEALQEAMDELERCRRLMKVTAEVFRKILEEERQRK